MINGPIAIRLKNVSKIYSSRRNATTLKEYVYKALGQVDKQESSICALSEITFSINRGETLGIIGDNGAGKSTLLKLICGIISPSSGTIDRYGKIGTVLDYGTGFHPELTGRENIYFNGQILGMSKKEIGVHYNSIVEFSELGKHINMPVKLYSSGMYLRLAFSIILHLDVDILILDEIMSAGDINFRLKSYQRLRDISKTNKTLVIASHDLGAIAQLCDRCVVLDKGVIQIIDSPDKATVDYVEASLTRVINNDVASLEEQKTTLAEELSETEDVPSIVLDYESDSSNKVNGDAPITPLVQGQFRKREKKEGELIEKHAQKPKTESTNEPISETPIVVTPTKKQSASHYNLSLSAGINFIDDTSLQSGLFHNSKISILKVTLTNHKKGEVNQLVMNEPTSLLIDYFVTEKNDYSFSILVKNHYDYPVFIYSTKLNTENTAFFEPGGRKQMCVDFPRPFFNEGLFFLHLYIIDSQSNVIKELDKIIMFKVIVSEQLNKTLQLKSFPGPLIIDLSVKLL